MNSYRAGQNFEGLRVKTDSGTMFHKNSVFTKKECLKEFIVDSGRTRCRMSMSAGRVESTVVHKFQRNCTDHA